MSYFYSRHPRPLPVCPCCKAKVDELDDHHGQCEECIAAECVQDNIGSPCRLLKIPAPCCGFVIEDGNWGYLDGPRGPDHCIHVDVMRSCRSCTSYWYRADQDPAWDIDGCAAELCPACRAEGITDADVTPEAMAAYLRREAFTVIERPRGGERR